MWLQKKKKKKGNNHSSILEPIESLNAMTLANERKIQRGGKEVSGHDGREREGRQKVDRDRAVWHGIIIFRCPHPTWKIYHRQAGGRGT